MALKIQQLVRSPRRWTRKNLRESRCVPFNMQGTSAWPVTARKTLDPQTWPLAEEIKQLDKSLDVYRRCLAEVARLIGGFNCWGNIVLARKRRKLTQIHISERMGLSRVTIGKIVGGLPLLQLATMAVLGVLGLADDLALVARDDELGNKLQDIQLKGGKRKL